MSRLKVILLVAALALVVLPLVWYQRVTRERTTAWIQSSSPDGMFRCTVTERASPGRSGTEIVFEGRRKNLTSPDSVGLWVEIKRANVNNDSASRSNYSVGWEYDEKHRTTGITVFGDFGTPPFPGKVLMLVPLSVQQPG